MRYGALIDADALANGRARGDWCIFDCRHQLIDPGAGERAYRIAHLPGARFLHLDRDLSAEPEAALCGGRHPLPRPAKMAALLGEFGVTPGTQVVAYDDAGGMIAARLWWMLRWLGHMDVAVLDGGIQAWQALGLPVDADLPNPAIVVGRYPARDGDGWVRVEEVLAGLSSRGTLVVDARSPDRFRGENETLDPVGGHIPGAINRFFRENLAVDGRMKPPGTLRQEWLELLGDRPSETVIHQCGSGVSACHNILAMTVAGLPGSRLYAGSWSEWCSDSARPVATGPN